MAAEHVDKLNMAAFRGGTIDMIMNTCSIVNETYSYLNELNSYERCDYILSLCKELDVDARESYQTFVKVGGQKHLVRVHLFDHLTTEEAVERILDSPSGGLRVLCGRGGSDFARLLSSLKEDIDFSIFTPYVCESEEERGNDYFRRNLQWKGIGVEMRRF